MARSAPAVEDAVLELGFLVLLLGFSLESTGAAVGDGEGSAGGVCATGGATGCAAATVGDTAGAAAGAAAGATAGAAAGVAALVATPCTVAAFGTDVGGMTAPFDAAGASPTLRAGAAGTAAGRGGVVAACARRSPVTGEALRRFARSEEAGGIDGERRRRAERDHSSSSIGQRACRFDRFVH